MMNSSEITIRLPPRREDEPATLRQDIVDEILDHLQCGVRRELLLHGGDEVSAHASVLRKFGDPRQIARKLWFQAMWSQIMSQRLVFGSALFSMAACTALVGMMGWMMQQQTQQANAAMQLQHQASVAMLEHLSKLVPQRTEPQPQRDLRWNLLQVRATIGGLDGPAAEKCSVFVSKLPTLGQVTTGTGSFSGLIGPSGLVECGYADSGRYQAIVRTSWSEQTIIAFTIHPGEDHIEHVVIPDRRPDLTQIDFQVPELPKEMAEKRLGLMIRISPQGSRIYAENTWSISGQWPQVATPVLFLSGDHDPRIGEQPSDLYRRQVQPGKWADLVEEIHWEPAHEWSLPASTYRTSYAIIDLKPKTQNSRIPFGDPATEEAIEPIEICGWLNAGFFVAEPGKLNEWKIQIPENVLRCLRDPSRIQEEINLSGGGGMGGGFF